MRILSFIFLCLTVFVSWAEPCPPISSTSRVALDEDQLLISVLRVNGRPLWDGFDVYPVGERYLVPASLFADALSLDWEVSMAQGSIQSEGSEDFCSFNHTFNQTLPILSNTRPDAFLWAADEFDIYIDTRMIAALLQIEQKFNYTLLQLNLTGRLPLNSSTNASADNPPLHFTPSVVPASKVVEDQYQLFTSPLVTYRLSKQDSASSDNRFSANINAGFDFLYHSANLRVSRVDDTSIHYLRFGKTLNENYQNTDNALNSFAYEFGDIQLQRDELVTRSGQSLGLIVHNGDTRQRRSFSSTSIEEFVLPGWRIQLFRNGQFIDEQFSNEENKVLFEDIETFYGANLFELKLYGPEGQQEVRTKTVNVGNNQLRQGKFDFLFGLTDNQFRLLDGQVSTTGVGKATVARLGYGLTDSATLSASVQRLWLEDGIASYVTAGINTQLFGSALKFEVSDQNTGGYGMFLGWNGRFSNSLNLNFSTRYFNNFYSDAYSQDDDIKYISSLRLNGKTEWLGRFGWNTSMTHRAYEFDDPQSALNVNLNDNFLGGTFASGFSVSNNSSAAVTGRLYYAKDVNGWNLSSAWNFIPSDRFSTDNFYVSMRWPQTLSQYRETRLRYRGDTDNALEIRHQHNWRFESLNIGLAASVMEGGDWSVNLSLTGNTNVNPYTQSLNFERSAGATAGRIDAFAYLDENRNLRQDTNEAPIEGVMFAGSSLWRDKSTDANGMVRLNTGARTQNLILKSDSLPDPYMLPAAGKVQVLTHPGGVNTAQFPVHTFNDVEGTIYVVGDSSSRGAAYVDIAIIDNTEQIVVKTRTESDGYFYVNAIPPGDYHIEIDNDYLIQQGLTIQSDALSFTAPAKGDSVFVDDILLARETALPNENLANHSATVQPVSSPDTTGKYEIQIGIFRHSRSIFEVMKHLPIAPESIQFHRNHSAGLTYVTVGRFDLFSEAKMILQKLNQHPTFSHAFISPSARFTGAHWRLEFILEDVQELIQNSLHRLESSSAERLCQLAAYQALSSINPTIFIQHPELMLLPNNNASPSFYRLVAPAASTSVCHDHYYGAEYRSGPYSVTRESLLTKQ